MKITDLSKSLPGKRKTVRDLIHYIRTGGSDLVRYALFLGAGASATSGIRTGSELVEEWITSLYLRENSKCKKTGVEEMRSWLTENLGDYNTDSEYGYLFEQVFSMPRQRRDFIEAEIADKIPSIGYPYAVRLAECNAFNTIFTTNFDDLINEAFYQFSKKRPYVCAHDSAIEGISVASLKTKIVKLHGDCLFSNLKNTPGETNKLSKNMEQKLREFTKLLGMIVVGYSGGDRSIMRLLNDLVDDDEYLQNGLYWCFRPTDDVNPAVLELLRKDGCFYVLIDGFDELMAELYDSLCGNALPFSSRPGSDFAATIIGSYISNQDLVESKSEVIRLHVKRLAEEQNSSLVAEAIQSLYREQGKDATLRDADFVKYIELEKLFRSRDYRHAFEEIRAIIDQCDNAKFKRILAGRLFEAAQALYQTEEAIKAIELLRSLQPENFFLAMPLADVTEDREKRIEILKKGIEDAPYEEAIQLQYANEIEEAYHSAEPKKRPTALQVVDAYQKAIKLYPVIENGAWIDLFTFLKSPFAVVEEKDDILKWIVDQHLDQDAFDSRSVEILIEWCKIKNLNEYRGKKADTWVIEAFERHFPRKYASHLSVIRDLVIQSGEFAVLSHVIPICEREPSIERDSNYVGVKMDLLYKVYRDLDGAILLGEDFVSKRPSIGIEKSLFGMYLEANKIDEAERQLSRLKGALGFDSYRRHEARLLEYKGLYQDAIDVMSSIERRVGSGEDYTTYLSYLQLKMGANSSAMQSTKDFLQKSNFSLRYEAAIINYELARKRLNKSISRQRLEPLAKSSQNDGVKAAANLLMGSESEAMRLLEGLVRKDFSMFEEISRWPAVEPIRDEVMRLYPTLIKERRSFPKNAVSDDSLAVIDV